MRKKLMRQKILRKRFASEKEFRNFRGELHQSLRAVLVSYISQKGDLEQDLTMLEIAVNEAINNAFKYARNKSEPAVMLSIYIFEPNILFIRVKDNGSGFKADQVLAKVDALEKSEEDGWEWGESGRGIFIMEAVMDKVRYNAKGNSVVLLKTLS